MFFLSSAQAQKKIAENCRARRLQMGWTQAELAARAGVALASLRRFERQSALSLESFLKLQMALGGLSDVVAATEGAAEGFLSLDDVLRQNSAPLRQRGRRQ